MSNTQTIEPGRKERTAPYLKPSQVEARQEERKHFADMLNAPPHLRRAIQDPAQMMRTLKGIETSLNNDSPKEYATGDKDTIVKREKELLAKITADMPTQAEMRRNPPGALDKHIMWEQRHEGDIAEWKNIRRRMLASGMLPDSLSERSASNYEMYRPAGGSGELNMDNAQIPQTRTFYGLGGRSTPFTDDELSVLKILAPGIYDKVALMSADQRDEVKAAIADAVPTPIDELDFKGARERCRALGLETSGSHDVLLNRLRENAAELARAAA